MSVLFFLLGFSACKRNPVERLTNPMSESAVPQSAAIYTIYDEELKTGGGLGFIPSGDNQSINLADQTSPRRTVNAIGYTWNGNDPSPGNHLFAGFSLLITPNFTNLTSAMGKDLSASGYTKMKFFIRGALSSHTTLRIEGPDDGDGGITPSRTELTSTDLTSDWRAVTLNITPSHFNNVKVFATFSFQYAQPPRTTNAGEGGTIYIDDIQYEP
ncbi:MAG: hypothetical protein ACKVQC_09745 [Elusimicrobiota bacterium]